MKQEIQIADKPTLDLILSKMEQLETKISSISSTVSSLQTSNTSLATKISSLESSNLHHRILKRHGIVSTSDSITNKMEVNINQKGKLLGAILYTASSLLSPGYGNGAYLSIKINGNFIYRNKYTKQTGVAGDYTTNRCCLGVLSNDFFNLPSDFYESTNVMNKFEDYKAYPNSVLYDFSFIRDVDNNRPTDQLPGAIISSTSGKESIILYTDKPIPFNTLDVYPYHYNNSPSVAELIVVYTLD